MDARERKIRRRNRLLRWLPGVLSTVMRLLWTTVRYRCSVAPGTRRLLASGKPFIIAFWHEHILMMPFLFRAELSRGRTVWSLVSRHWDGEMIARTVGALGVRSIRGSSTRGGSEAYGQMVGKVQAGEVVCITPDGPAGPRGYVHAGVLRLARDTGVPIVPVAWSARPRVRLMTWDRFQIPLPFARVRARFGEPLVVVGPEEPGWLEPWRARLKRRMGHAGAEADSEARDGAVSGLLWLVYNSVLSLASVVLLPYYLCRIMVESRPFAGLRERLGLYALGAPRERGREGGGPVWVHAVSVGEVRATVPLCRRLQASRPGLDLVASTVTPTGRAVARQELKDARAVVFFPLDYPVCARAALRRLRPRLFVLAETEIWPNFLRALGKRGIPAVLINGRLSPRSSRRYGWFRFFFRRVLANVHVFGVQTREDGLRLIRIGADPRRVLVTGNMKFDIPLPADREGTMRRTRSEMGLAPETVVFVAGSTHAGEEEVVLEVYGRLRELEPGLKLLIAPRHPERSDAVEALCVDAGCSVTRRTRQGAAGAGALDAQVLLLDTIGELAAAYSVGDVVFVGGSLMPVGGHNLLEPAVYGKPVLFGPHVDEIADIARAVRASGGGVEVPDGEALYREARSLLADRGSRIGMGAEALGILERNGGATERNLAILEPFLADR